MKRKEVREKVSCFHCGDPCESEHVLFQEKDFCCHGCRSVYELLQACDLEDYYDYADNPGIKTLKAPASDRFAYLQDESIQTKLLSFKSENLAKVSLKLPAMHCASCIWLIENFRKLVPGVIESRVNFVKREAAFTYDPQIVSLRRLVEQLAAIGYEPELNLESTSQKKNHRGNFKLITQIGLAGFCFGNIMLLSFPEYLAIGEELTIQYRSFFGYLNFALALPVLIYSASDYLKSAWRAVVRRVINMDVPISMGILAIFLRSTYEIFFEGGGGYMDSLSALVFFLLVGKWFQQKTYDSLSFERDFKSYFPISVQKLDGEIEKSIGIEQIQPGDQFRVRSGELIPVDATLIEGDARIDYSFVSGESDAVKVQGGEALYAGGRQTGASIVLEATKSVDQSYLTGLWNSDGDQKEEHELESFADRVGKIFTYVILFIALSAGAFWMVFDPGLVLNAVSAVLIVACPCALALSFPFAYGNAIRLAGRKGLYLKNAAALGRMAEVSHIVFDKTGTLTRGSDSTVEIAEFELSPLDKAVAAAMASQSGHPLSRMIAKSLNAADQPLPEIVNFNEVKGKGLKAEFAGDRYRLGSADFSGACLAKEHPKNASTVCFSRNGETVAFFSIKKEYRSGLNGLISNLKKFYSVYLLSGDNDSEKERMQEVFGQRNGLLFNQLPHQKREFVAKLRRQGAITAMIGDGLNDAAALKESDLGISVADDVFRFAPASDAILSTDGFHHLPDFFNFSKEVLKTVRLSFALSFLYNGIGLFFAVQGILTPVIAAILMPISSITVVAFVTLRTTILYRNKFAQYSSG
ncbi:MAG TPA: heavy metal translocating P-type ATPase metal-binding domain-containing protein [Cryomorphaceae bacterium]|nr:heavy metal translocating P-type ATPase metal-binding domain-containing protein [Cryomorphaceae bacterium]